MATYAVTGANRGIRLEVICRQLRRGEWLCGLAATNRRSWMSLGVRLERGWSSPSGEAISAWLEADRWLPDRMG